MERPILITGFGSFPGVEDNPSGRLATAVDGRRIAGVPVVGRVLPVAWERGPERAITLARSLDARAVVGLGVAQAREGVSVEAVGKRACRAMPDVDGEVRSDLGPGPERVPATLDPRRLATLLGATISEDAGGYVCNAWAWHVPRALSVPAVFVHLPPEGLDPSRLEAALEVLLAEGALD
jgi:pyroglutamyl-peptidase